MIVHEGIILGIEYMGTPGMMQAIEIPGEGSVLELAGLNVAATVDHFDVQLLPHGHEGFEVPSDSLTNQGGGRALCGDPSLFRRDRNIHREFSSRECHGHVDGRIGKKDNVYRRCTKSFMPNPRRILARWQAGERKPSVCIGYDELLV